MADFGVSAIIALAGVAVSAATAGVSTALTISAANDQADSQKNIARAQADAERAAGEARRKQIEYDASRKRKSMLSREASAGVQVSQGSLLEDEMQFEREASYSAQLAAYPHTAGAQLLDYQSSLFRQRSAVLPTGVAIGSSLASGARSLKDIKWPGFGSGYGTIDPTTAGPNLPY